MLLSSWTIEKEQDTEANPGWLGNGESFPRFTACPAFWGIGDYINVCPVASLVSARNRPNTGRFLRGGLIVLPLTKSPS
jgi:hypothetical protein